MSIVCFNNYFYLCNAIAYIADILELNGFRSIGFIPIICVYVIITQ